jgi:predicted nucleic acid-binding protein
VTVLSRNESDLGLAKELRTLSRQCDIPELLSLAVAIKEKADVFMTLDAEMLNERFRSDVKKEYRITVQKPKPT